jgi:hypothetical protein
MPGGANAAGFGTAGGGYAGYRNVIPSLRRRDRFYAESGPRTGAIVGGDVASASFTADSAKMLRYLRRI